MSETSFLHHWRKKSVWITYSIPNCLALKKPIQVGPIGSYPLPLILSKIGVEIK